MNTGNGPTFHFGDQVNINGGDGHIGVQHNHGGADDTGMRPEVSAMFAQLALLVRELSHQAGIDAEDRQSLAETLPVLNQPATVERHRWRDTLRVLSGLARDIGDTALPVLNVATELMNLIRP
ncbi:hypothetical protein [Streptacidiphilus sp. P02-A3a]|uniref:hypothetical protein n=1 Tax=Streptacidiphilus sp. P02-A3a TaxID=2704468 RepID=UPI001CDCC59B|nr:hypothetical protein [Streptacidiphilus sp. P02-A3a]